MRGHHRDDEGEELRERRKRSGGLVLAHDMCLNCLWLRENECEYGYRCIRCCVSWWSGDATMHALAKACSCLGREEGRGGWPRCVVR